MIRIRLSESEAQRLEAEFRSAQQRNYRDRLQIVLLAHRGRPRKDIAVDLCVSTRCVTRWLNAYCERGPAGLLPKKARGQTPGIPADLADEVKRWVIEGPAKQGLDRANWTYEELADHLLKTHGVETSRSAMHRFCSKIGVRPYRPTYRYLRGDPSKQAQARDDLAVLKKGRLRANSSC
jgi:transposase